MANTNKIVKMPADTWAGEPVEEEAPAPVELGEEEAAPVEEPAQLAEEESGEPAPVGSEEEEAPPATSADGVFEPDQSWLTNPAPENEDELIKQQDDARLAQLRAEQRLLILEAREYLKAPGAIVGFIGKSKGETHNYKAFAIYDARNQIRKTGALSVKIKLRMSQIDAGALSRYLSCYANFKGTGNEVVSQIAHDLYILLRPKSVDVSFKVNEIDSEVTYNAGEEWG